MVTETRGVKNNLMANLQKMMKKLNIFFLNVLACAVFIACAEERHQAITEGAKPVKISKYKVENFYGAAEIEYTIPDDNVSYVLAEYSPREGTKKEAKSSKYNNRLRLEGFSKAGSYDVVLYAVGRDEQRSEGITLKVEPLNPPIEESFKTLEVKADFGGLNVRCLNEGQTDMAIEVIVKTKEGDWKPADTHYTNSLNVNFSVRGFEPEEYQFGVAIRDRWSNYTDTLYTVVTPFFEEKINMDGFVETNFPGDTYQGHPTGVTDPKGRWLYYLFDGVTGEQTKSFYTVLNSGIPQHFTVECMGRLPAEPAPAVAAGIYHHVL